MSNKNWKLDLHHEADVPYYEITNGPISLCVNEDDIPEKNGELELDAWQLLDTIKNTLNSANLNFRSENKLELDQHLTICELQIVNKQLKDILGEFISMHETGLLPNRFTYEKAKNHINATPQ